MLSKRDRKEDGFIEDGRDPSEGRTFQITDTTNKADKFTATVIVKSSKACNFGPNRRGLALPCALRHYNGVVKFLNGFHHNPIPQHSPIIVQRYQ